MSYVPFKDDIDVKFDKKVSLVGFKDNSSEIELAKLFSRKSNRKVPEKKKNEKNSEKTNLKYEDTIESDGDAIFTKIQKCVWFFYNFKLFYFCDFQRCIRSNRPPSLYLNRIDKKSNFPNFRPTFISIPRVETQFMSFYL